MSFSDKFGGSSVQPSNVQYRAVALAASATTFWPPYATSGNVLARLMDVQATAGTFSISLPDATLASTGDDVVFINSGAFNFEVKNFAGTTLYTVTPGQRIYFYLKSTATQAGTWDSWIFGVGLSNLDLSNAAGNGLVVASSRLAVSPIASAVAGDRTIAAGDRATAFLWTGGTGTFTLPLSSTLGQFFFEVRNQGTGALTIATSGGELIDGSASIILQLNESAIIHAGTGLWYTVGRGRATQFAFTQLQKVVTGGTVTETLTEAANVVQTFTGVLTSNVDIVVPAVVQVYYVSNQTSGAFNFRVKNPGAGATVSIPTGQNAVLFSDGTNVINASTTVAGISSLVLGAGSAGSPSLGVGASNTGLFSPGSNQMGVSANSVQVATFSATGLNIPVNGGNIGVTSASGNASIELSRPSGAFGVVNFYTLGVQRWRAGVDSTAESGSNAGSDYGFTRYNDAGTLVDTPVKITRSTGLVTLLAGLTASGGNVTVSAGKIDATSGGTGPALVGTSTNASGGNTQLTDTGASGVVVKLTGNGGTTPSKSLRVQGGNFHMLNNAGTTIMTVTDAGALTMADNITAFSDARLKSNVHTAHRALDKLLTLRGVEFDRAGRKGRGVIAQELQKVYPELVHEEPVSGMLTVDYMGLTGELIEAVKTLAEKVRYQ